MGFIKRLLGLETKEERQKRINWRIENDPVLKKIDKELERLNKDAADRIKSDPEKVEMFRRIGIDVNDIG